ncbi:synaptobrevin [Gaeumannomyces tritici R3-111a-1]|uniref:Synaptobrevin n=1 Tax=Gaeumannomyces tritici (strain R3-111a-1) TaxID=644352 RepID=J3NIE6_GAET3|nr:synaptobrevin [Gaeumannomyces tritici R3-111a-1]EJT81039.1 synaptobrevin [Gaeumannomyces tritici R3-111a-1]
MSTLTATRAVDPLAELNRLLSRLQQSTLRADAERQRRLVASEFERRKVDTSIKHARALLTGLEHETLSVKVHARRQALQAVLSQNRELIDELAERIRDLDEMADARGAGPIGRADNGGDDEEDDGDEDILSEVCGNLASAADPGADLASPEPASPPPPSTRAPRRRPDTSQTRGRGSTTTPAPSAPPGTEGTTTSQTLRSRAPKATPDGGSGGDTTTATAATGRSLFGDSADGRAPSTSQLATTESILDQQRAEQDLLSESILRMASSLKESSRAFASSLEEDKHVLSRAGDGLNKNEQGLEAAARQMGFLTRMAEGEGFIGRMKLYVMVYGLMMFLILLVFAMPKLRL